MPRPFLWCRSLGAPVAAAGLLAACLLYYGGRVRLEEDVLQTVFGAEYARYRARTGRFLPRLLPPAAGR